MKIAGMYLAAGQSSRMGQPKLAMELSPGITLGSVALKELARCGLEPLVVVAAADDPLKWLPQDFAGDDGTVPWRTIRSEEARRGLSFSLRRGLKEVRKENPGAVLIALADQPFVNTELVSLLIRTLRDRPDSDFVAWGVDGQAYPPALFPRHMFPHLEALDGDQGARSIIKGPEYNGIVLDMEKSEQFSKFVDFCADADTWEDFKRIQAIWVRKTGAEGQ